MTHHAIRFLCVVRAVHSLTLGVLLYDGFEQLDVFGPLEMFKAATMDVGGDTSGNQATTQ